MDVTVSAVETHKLEKTTGEIVLRILILFNNGGRIEIDMKPGATAYETADTWRAVAKIMDDIGDVGANQAH